MDTGECLKELKTKNTVFLYICAERRPNAKIAYARTELMSAPVSGIKSRSVGSFSVLIQAVWIFTQKLKNIDREG